MHKPQTLHLYQSESPPTTSQKFNATSHLVHIEETSYQTQPPIDLAQYKIHHTVDSTIEERSEEQECTQSIEDKKSQEDRDEKKSDLSKSIPISSSVDVSGNIERNQHKLKLLTSHSRISSQGQTPNNLSMSSGISGSSTGDKSLLDMKAQQQQLL
jgi:hypothetical protein